MAPLNTLASGWGSSAPGAWDDQTDELTEGEHQGTIFDFACWDAKNGLTYVKFGFQVGELKIQRFYEVKPNTVWVLEKDLRTVLGRVPAIEEVQAESRTGPIRGDLIGKSVSLFHGERNGWTDVYIDAAVGGEDGQAPKYTGGGMEPADEMENW